MNAQKKRMRTDNYNNNGNQNRGGFNNNNGGGFGNRPGKVDLRIMLPSKVKKNQIKKLVLGFLIFNYLFVKDAGAIIGRGGANIKKLRSEVSGRACFLYFLFTRFYILCLSRGMGTWNIS